MATTAAGTPYVESSDLVANYPGVSLALADHIDGLDGGKVLQVVYASTSTNVTTTSASFVDTGLSASITPSATTSKVIILVTQQFLVNRTGTTALGRLQIVRNSTSIIQGQAEQFGIYKSVSSDLGIRGIVAMNYQDSPSTTSATTYKTQFYSDGAATLITQYASNPSTIILMEIAA